MQKMRSKRAGFEDRKKKNKQRDQGMEHKKGDREMKKLRFYWTVLSVKLMTDMLQKG